LFSSCSILSFEPFPWHVAAWKWLLEKHPIARQAFFAIGYRPRPKEPAIDSSQPSWADFLLVTQVKIVVVDRRNQSLHVVSDKEDLKLIYLVFRK